MIGRLLGLVLVAGGGFAAGIAAAEVRRRGAAGGFGGFGGGGGGGLAHRVDGSDDSGSLAAGIADQGLIPDRVEMADTMPGGLATVS